MISRDSMAFLKELTEIPSPSGYEQEAAAVWKERTRKHCETVDTDIHGNTIAVLNGKKKIKIMLAGHIDEIGYMIKYIDNDGFLFFSTVGGIDLHLVPGQRVLIKTRKGRLTGVIGRKPIHLLEDEERKRVAKLENLWIDIGAGNKEEAAGLVEVGDIAVPAVGLEELRGGNIIARGLDDKAGAFIVSETLKALKGKKFSSAVYGVATVQEEIGLRGATTSAYGIDPLVGIAVEVAFATDFPLMDKKTVGDIRLGAGPVIARGPNINPVLFDLLVETAKKEKIPYQVKGIPRGTGTDANVIQLNRAGAAAGLVSIPLRYMHTPVELVNTADIENTIKLLAAFIEGLDPETSFIPS